MCFSVQADIYGATGANLRYFRPEEVKNKTHKVVGYKSHSYQVKMTITNSTFEKIEDVFNLIKKEVLDKFPANQKIYTYIYKHHHKTSQELKEDPEDDWCFIGESDFQRVERDETGTIKRIPLSKKEFRSCAGGDDLEARGYVRINLITYMGFKDGVMLKKKKFKFEHLNLDEF